MKICAIEYRLRKDDRFMYSKHVHIISPEKAIKMAGIQDAYEYSVTEFAHPFKLGSRYYSPKLGTYNAVWLTQEGDKKCTTANIVSMDSIESLKALILWDITFLLSTVKNPAMLMS